MPKMHFFSFDIESFNLANLLFIVARNKKHNVHGRHLTFCLVMQAAPYPQTDISWLVLHLVVLVCGSQRAQGLNSCNNIVILCKFDFDNICCLQTYAES